MKSIGTEPSNHAPEGDERIRTAVPGGTNDPEYELRVPASCSHVVVYRNAKGAAAGFLGPFSLTRARAECEWHRAKHPQARASVFALARAAVARAGTDNT